MVINRDKSPNRCKYVYYIEMYMSIYIYIYIASDFFSADIMINHENWWYPKHPHSETLVLE